MSNPFRILCVCTGNICRSPAIEIMLRDGLEEGFEVFSRGTRALVGNPVDPKMAMLLAGDGHDPSSFVAARLNPRLDVTGTDLVLTATRDHRSLVVERAPAAWKKTFTLLEFARLVARNPDHPTGATAPERMKELVSMVGDRRGHGAGEDDDVVDPYRLGPEVFQASHAQIRSGVDAILTALSPTPRQG